jgi:hypothetical protein
MFRLRVFITLCLMLLALPALAAAAPAGGAAAGDSWDEQYNLDVNLSQFAGRFYDVLTKEEYYGKYPAVRGIAEIAKRMGYFNLDNLSCEYTIEDGQIYYRFSEHYADLAPESYLGKVYALPNRELVSAEYIGQEDFLLYFGMNNLPQQILLSLQEVGTIAANPPAGLENELADIGEMGQVLGMITAMGIDKQIESVLTGEVALALYTLDPGKMMSGECSPHDIDAAAFLGLAGAEQLKTLLAGFGAQAGLSPIDSGSPAWTAYEFAELPGAGLMFNDEILVAAPSLTRAAEHLRAAGSGFAPGSLQYYFDVNATALHNQLVAPLVDFGMGMAASEGMQFPTAAMGYLWGLPESSALGHITVQSQFDEGTLCELQMSTAVPQYLGYYLTTGAAGFLEGELRKEFDNGGMDNDMGMEAEEEADEMEEMDEAGEAELPEVPVPPTEPAPSV